MEMELSKLIDKIKKEGVQQAEKDAGEVIKDAQAKAGRIIQDAEKKRGVILDDAEKRSRDFKTASEKALKQSARDVLLTLRERVTDFQTGS